MACEQCRRGKNGLNRANPNHAYYVKRNTWEKKCEDGEVLRGRGGSRLSFFEDICSEPSKNAGYVFVFCSSSSSFNRSFTTRVLCHFSPPQNKDVFMKNMKNIKYQELDIMLTTPSIKILAPLHHWEIARWASVASWISQSGIFPGHTKLPTAPEIKQVQRIFEVPPLFSVKLQ